MSKLLPVPIAPPPGVVVTESGRAAEGRWIAPFDKIRFVHGRPQKIGGNVRVSTTAMSGTPRATLCWQDYLQNGYVSCGTYRKLYAFDSGYNLTDITPFRATGTLGNNPFTCTSGSASVEVNQSGHGVNVGDTVIYSGAASGGTPSIWADFAAGNYWYNGSSYASFSLWLAAVGGTFTRASTAYYTNSSGLLASAAINALRFDYDPVALTSKGILLEGASTNVLTYSNDFTNAAWQKLDGGAGSLPVVTAAAGTAPDGTNTAQRVQFNKGSASSANISLLHQAATGSSAIYSYGVWIKSNTGSSQNVVVYTAAGKGNVVVATTSWQRLTAPSDTVAATNPGLLFGTRGVPGSGNYYDGGDVSLDLLVWNATIEPLPFLSSDIVTTSAAVTRAADNFSVPASSWFNGPASTMFLNWSAPNDAGTGTGGAGFSIAAHPGTDYFGVDTRNGPRVQMAAASVNQIDVEPNGSGVPSKVGVSYGSSSYAVATDKPATATGSITATPTGIDTLTFAPTWDNTQANNVNQQWFVQFGYWPCAATLTQLQTLTSSPTLGPGGSAPSWLPYFSGDAPNMNGTFLCATVVDANNYNVTAGSTATISQSFGGSSVAYEYEIAVGTELGAYGLGWGVGPWGLGTWGTPRGSSTIFNEPRVWTLDHFGDIMVATYNGGTLWFFDPTQAEPWPRAVATYNSLTVNGAPTNCRALFVSPERFIFVLCDNMVVNVSSQGDPTTWTPATTNTAFSRTLQFGTKLVDGVSIAPFISLVWSDYALYLFQYTGSQFLYNSSVVGTDCGLISPNAAIAVDGIAYWMGPDKFYMYNGGTVTPMANVNDIRKYVYDSLSPSTYFQASAIYVPKYHEIWWFYTASGASNPTNYVIYSIDDQCWSVGTANFFSSSGVTAGRTSGSHFSSGDTSPIMAASDGFLYNHDPLSGTYDDNTNPLTWTLTLAPYALQEGLDNVDVEGIVFDFFQQSGNISATTNMYDRLTDAAPMDTQTQVVPATLAGLTDYRVGGRYISLSMTSSDLGNYMRWGKPAAFIKPAGTRR